MFFQNTILRKHLALLPEDQVTAAWAQYQAYFLDPQIQQNIRQSKEEQFQEGFLNELFVKVLGYTLNPSPNYNLITEQKNETNAKKADGAILLNEVSSEGIPSLTSSSEGFHAFTQKVIGIIELKDHKTTDLKQVEQQAFGYKHQHPAARYVIISNFEKLRFYIDNAVECMEWNLFTLTEEQFRVLYFCLSYPTLSQFEPVQAKTESVSSEDQITARLYKDYSAFKRELFADIEKNNVGTQPSSAAADRLTLFKKTQKLLDRLLFIFFAEDCGLLPPNSMIQIIDQWQQLRDLDEYVPLYNRIKKYFGYMNTGYKGKHYDIFAYNGGLFKPDEVLDSLVISDELLAIHCRRLSEYDYASEVDVNILGHIFENSLNEIEEFYNNATGSAENSPSKLEGAGGRVSDTPSKRKRDGVFYTPQYITKYIVENTLGRLCEEKKAELGISGYAAVSAAVLGTRLSSAAENSPSKLEGVGGRVADSRTSNKRKALSQLEAYREWLLGLKICDPACGSGAFLNAALQFLMAEHRLIDEMQAKITGDSIVFQNIENSILENNLYGVDINEESVEIAKLALWLRVAKPHRKLSSLNDNIKCGNSLISDPAIAGDKAFDWAKEFPQVFGTQAARLTGNDDAGTQAARLSESEYKSYYAAHYEEKGIINRSRHYLPHFENRSLQFITYRLYDSVPKEVVEKYKEELGILENKEVSEEQKIQLINKIDKYEDAGYGQCFLKDERVAKIVEENLWHFHGKRYELINYCIMPNHVHVLIRILPNNSLSDIMHSWRSYTAHEANKVLNRTGDFWMNEYFDRYIRNQEHFAKVYNYINNNPLKAGLVETADQWRWCYPAGSLRWNAGDWNAGGSPDGDITAADKRAACVPTEVSTADERQASRLRSNGGFDVVIGNPPYIRPHNLADKDKVYYWNTYSVAQQKTDIYAFFVEKACSLLKPNGKLGFIIPKTWWSIYSFQKLRSLLLNQYNLHHIGLLPQKVFADATVETALMFVDNNTEKTNLTFEDIETGKLVKSIAKADILSTPEMNITPEEEQKLQNVTPLGDLCEIIVGIVTGNDEKYCRFEKITDIDVCNTLKVVHKII